MLNNTWKKLGLLIEPQQEVWWMSHFCGPTFADLSGTDIQLYVVGRDENGISRIGIVVLSKENPQKVLSIGDEPVLDVGEVGCFDESGVSYPWLVNVNGTKKLYYGGWQAGGIGGFSVNIGLAEYNENTNRFERVSRAPILPRIDEEPICTGSLAVHKFNQQWFMYYTCFVKWERQKDNSYKHFYLVKVCQSDDGVNWQRPGVTVLDLNSDSEHVICKPMIIKENEIMRMWLSCRGDKYRIGYAESIDGIKWSRKDEEFRWTEAVQCTNSFDSEMQEYAFIFDVRGERYMTYNGNGYGKSGVGLAILQKT